MKKYQYILLDWDGNLAKTLDIWLEAFKVPMVARGFHLTDEEVGSSFGSFQEHMAARGMIDVEEAFQEAVDVAKHRLPSVELYPDALEVLEFLHSSGKKLALITTSSHAAVDPLLKSHGLDRLFDVVVCSDDTTHHKPNPEPLEKALSLLGGSKDQAIMIGDSDKDLGAANNFGIDSVLFYPDEHKKFYSIGSLKELNPTYVVEDFKEIMGLV